jgi:hypothetical protein
VLLRPHAQALRESCSVTVAEPHGKRVRSGEQVGISSYWPGIDVAVGLLEFRIAHSSFVKSAGVGEATEIRDMNQLYRPQRMRVQRREFLRVMN